MLFADFRSKNGIYNSLDCEELGLPCPEFLFDKEYFLDDPLPFYRFSGRVFLNDQIQPTPTHRLFRKLEEAGKLVRVYTQNVDGLEVMAGLPRDKVVFCHGSFLDWTCLRCKKKRPLAEMEAVLSAGVVGRCDDCGGLIKPDMTFFGEKVPRGVMSSFNRDKRQADICLVLGTSLSVAPVSTLVTKLPVKCKRVLVNREAVQAPIERNEKEDEEGGGGKVDARSRFDVGLFGECDDCSLLLGRVLVGDEEERKERMELTRRKVQFRHIGESFRCGGEEDKVSDRERKMVERGMGLMEEEKSEEKEAKTKKKKRKREEIKTKKRQKKQKRKDT